MLLYELFDKTPQKVAYFCFGRCNPPTRGHQQLFDTLATSANSNPYFIFLSQTHDAKKNPLNYDTKIQFIRKMFKQHGKHVVGNRGIKTIFDACVYLENQGYTDIVLVAGDDRVSEFKNRLTSYNGTSFNFNSINVVSSGERDEDATGIEGYSATNAREAAKEDDLEAFQKAVGYTGPLVKQLFEAVKKGMFVDIEECTSAGAFATVSAPLFKKTIKRKK